jgi:hypothetical protein
MRTSHERDRSKRFIVIDRSLENTNNSHMKIAPISEINIQLSAPSDAVKRGKTVLTMDRDDSAARLEPVAGGDWRDSEGRLARLERAGTLTRAKETPVLDIFDKPRPKPKEGASLFVALRVEREIG